MGNAVALASDHAGFELKKHLQPFLRELGYEVHDLGTDSTESVDYPDFGHALANCLLSGIARWGIAICGSGIGISIAANRHPGIRAALCQNAAQAALARQHNDANILALGARMVSEQTAQECVKTFLSTAFEGGRHEKRVKKLDQE